jgi:hypothetical protein
MKKIFLTLGLVISMSSLSYSQEVKCNDLLDYIVEKGYKKTTLQSYILNSSWLYKVTAYSYDYKIYVVAEIKENEYSYKTNTYIFCGIPSMNWQNFQYGGYGDPTSYGERFHKYILDYQCNCN